LALENAAIKDVLIKILTPCAKRQVVEVMVAEHRLSITRACRAAGLSRAAYYKVLPLPQEKDAEVIIRSTASSSAMAVGDSGSALTGCAWTAGRGTTNASGGCTANWG
jgi:hypothetical protein